MCVCMYIYVYVCMHVCMYICVCVCVCACVYVYGGADHPLLMMSQILTRPIALTES